ncbi:hypothetical protein [Embleya sp. AB8]|uniref:hypothetical protein n=1 Tax=Embleya sp. AB8 TaxID=3156304 RepID=UPI003C772A33
MSQDRRNNASDDGCGCGGSDPAPVPPVRNRFYPGKLMDVRHWYVEQDYHRQTAATLARLGLGTGVLCGLDVELGTDGALTVTPGVAVDGHGKLIVVDRPVRIDKPNQPTDCAGQATGSPVSTGTVAVLVCRHECGTEFVRMPVVDCEVREECVPSLTLERFSIRIVAQDPTPVGLTDKQCATIFPPRRGEGFDRREVVADTVGHDCGCADDCVVLGTVTYAPPAAPDLDATTSRPVVYSNRVLFDLLMCLAARVDTCCATTVPPRITALWPQVGAAATGATWRAFVAEKRLEIAFDRPLVDAAFDAPDTWLGLWQLDHTGARRLTLTRAGGAFTHIAVPAGGEGVAYTVGLQSDGLPTSTVFVVGSRVPVSGPPRAQGPDGLALDPDLIGTALTQADRDALWAQVSGGAKDTTLTALVDRAPLPNVPPFPTGNGNQGGELHVFTPPPPPSFAPETIEHGPRLLRVWPEGGSRLDRAGMSAPQWAHFVRTPRIELTLDAPLADAPLADPTGWIRLFQAVHDGDWIGGFRPLELGPGARTMPESDRPLPADSVTYAFDVRGIRPPAGHEPDAVFLFQIRSSTAAPVPPVGADTPTLPLDADFLGTALDNHALFSIWTGQQLPRPLPPSVVGARSTVGERLFGDNPGGFLHIAFAVAPE